MNEIAEMTVTPVKYYVGDLCYVMHDCWDEVCDLMFSADEGMEYGEHELSDGRKFVIYGTAYGDGSYNDKDGNPYAVDSGTIGAIKVNDILDVEGYNRTVEGGYGHVHEFPAEIDAMDCCSEDGVIRIYNVEIDTAGSDWEEEEEEDDADW